MGDTNYFSGTVKILNNPTQKLVQKKTLMTKVWVEIAQLRQNKLILVVFWGNLGDEVKHIYQINDYLLIEGYTSIKKTNSKLNKIVITGLKVYPLFLTLSKTSTKNLNQSY
jgi:primosomal replication protein N